jgi:universal stress protein E
MFAKIVVLARGNDPQQPAVERAAACAGRSTQLAILDIVHEPALDGYMGNSAIYEPLRARVVAERSERVQGLVAALRARGLHSTGEAAWDHPLDEAIAKRVRAQSASIVVIAPAAAPAGGLSLSDWRVISTCPAPVLVVKRAPDRKYRYIVAAVDPFHAHAKPADLDLAILARAHELQEQTGALLTVVHCHAPVEFFGAAATRPAGTAAGDAERREALEALVKESGISAAAALVVAGAPQEVLKRMAERGEADVIVMGALARGRLKDWWIGSTAERVLHSVQADVLAVKPEHAS